MSPKTTRKQIAKKETRQESKRLERYVEAVGRRKTAIARVRLYPETVKDKDQIIVNGKNFPAYFSMKRHQRIVSAAFEAAAIRYRTSVMVSGGGLNAQAEAIRLGIARALTVINPAYRSLLKQLGYLKRDPRMVERKHPGLRKARRAQQWRKR